MYYFELQQHGILFKNLLEFGSRLIYRIEKIPRSLLLHANNSHQLSVGAWNGAIVQITSGVILLSFEQHLRQKQYRLIKKKLPILNLASSTFLNIMITITRSSKFKAEHQRRTRKYLSTLCDLIGYECNFFLLRFLYSVTPFLNDPRKKVGTSQS